jgi:hypothetical protein
VYKISEASYPESRAFTISPGETTSTYLIPLQLFLITRKIYELLLAFIAYDRWKP